MVLDEGEEASAGRTHCMRFQHPSLYMPESMNRTKASALDGPKPGVLPVAPLTSAVAAVNGKQITSIDDQGTLARRGHSAPKARPRDEGKV